MRLTSSGTRATSYHDVSRCRSKLWLVDLPSVDSEDQQYHRAIIQELQKIKNADHRVQLMLYYRYEVRNHCAYLSQLYAACFQSNYSATSPSIAAANSLRDDVKNALLHFSKMLNMLNDALNIAAEQRAGNRNLKPHRVFNKLLPAMQYKKVDTCWRFVAMDKPQENGAGVPYVLVHRYIFGGVKAAQSLEDTEASKDLMADALTPYVSTGRPDRSSYSNIFDIELVIDSFQRSYVDDGNSSDKSLYLRMGDFPVDESDEDWYCLRHPSIYDISSMLTRDFGVVYQEARNPMGNNVTGAM